ncbi:hypothetical protein EDB86DRAFT_2833439 [Lactarius hatsudake]|nr:hypothetical protein EDB86DRAFT_2833439 [Lactarius hatsudake]
MYEEPRNSKDLQLCKLMLLGAFKSYGKKNFEYMTTIEQLRQKADQKKDKDKQLDDKLKLRPYDDKIGVFPCQSFNVGNQSTSLPHMDEKNLAQSWCSITPLDTFNPKKGGHIVL